MTVSILDHSKRFIISLLVFFSISSTALLSQKQLSGDLNQPFAHVITIGTDRVTVDDATGFSPGDTILLIQMQGVGILTPQTPAYGGTVQNISGEPGMHEFMLISAVNGGNEIVFGRNLLKTYNPLGNIQIVRVPYYNNATVTGKLTCDPWSTLSKKGGVLALIIGKTLELKADIDVSKSGFLGGKDVLGDGICLPSPLMYYPATFTNAGFKGEGAANFNADLSQPLIPNYAKGIGRQWNGGGGGSGKYSGGGGGSNQGRGGNGGYEDCFPTGAPADGGTIATHTSLLDRIFFGGGGGGSTSLTGLAPEGGAGGGIVIIVADDIIGNGGKIISNGGDGYSAGANSGSGGGGAGGSIALSVRSYGSTPFQIQLKGGKGGDNPGTFGEGGGGSGGLLYVKTNITPNVDTTTLGGLPGNDPNSTAFPGGYGKLKTGFKANLNGFLFNSIRSSRTGDTIDAVCSDMLPPRITGTIPVGGTGPYRYIWEKSYTGVFPGTELYNGYDSINYRSAVIETSTVYYRRTVISETEPLTDYSKVVKMVVQQAIADNNIVKDTTICSGQDPRSLRSNPLTPVPQNGTGVYSYKWLQNLNNTVWDTTQLATGVNTNLKYDPPALNVDTYYKRFVRSGRCINYSATVKITVLTTLTGNSTIRSDSVICEGGSFPALSATAWSGGDPAKYWYQWEESDDKGAGDIWANAYGTGIDPTYTADPLNFTAIEKRYFRRVVYSGKDSVCRSNSVPILLTRYYKIQDNSIQKDQTICSGKKFLTLTGVTASPTGGTGSYSYKWEQSPNGTGSWTNVSRASYSDTLGPQVLTANTWYRRVANSGVYKSLPVCINTSPSVSITVQPALKNNTISLKSGLTDSTICSGATPKSLTGLVPPALNGGNGTLYTYKWKYSTNNSTWTDIPAATAFNYQPSSLSESTWYRRVAVSGVCKDSANSVKINVLPPIVNTIPADRAVCINTPSAPIMGLTLSGGNTGQYKFLWESSPDGIVPWTNVTSDTIRIPAGANLLLPLLSQPVKYRRKVWSGPYNTCFSASNVLSVSVTQKPDPVFAGKDTLLRTFEYVYKLQALPPVSGTGLWSVPLGGGQVDDENKYNTYVRNLSDGLNTLLWTVSSSDKVCVFDTSVNITVMNIVVPQGISPNGDGKNDILKIYGLDFNIDESTGKPYQQIDLTIRNSAGAQVYHTSFGYGEEWVDWDGKTDGGADLPEGTYYYMLNILSNRVNSSQPYKGFIILKRN